MGGRAGGRAPTLSLLAYGIGEGLAIGGASGFEIPQGQ